MERDEWALRLGIELLISALIFLGMWWASLPEWKRKALLVKVSRARQELPVSVLAHEREVMTFRRQIVRWEHEQLGTCPPE